MALQEEFESQGNFLFKYRGTLPLIIVIIAIAVFITQQIDKSISDCSNTYFEFLSLIVSLFGLTIRIYTVGHTPANTSGRNTESQLADELNTSGIYSAVRHPLYLGNFFMWLGAAILTENIWFDVTFCLLYWVYYERIMYAEEQFLRRKFGVIYTDWAALTSAFIPAFSRWKAPKYVFSWKKVLKKEKNGLLAIFVLLFVFHNIAFSIKSNKFDIDFNWIFFGTIVSGILYLIFRILKKYSIL